MSACVDTLGRGLSDVRISVTDRCNFRCPYCMPADIFGESYSFLPRPELLSYEEIARLVGILASLGVSKARITGGEPLVRADLGDLIVRLAAIDGIDDIALTTNGALLVHQARRLAEAGLHRVTVSLDSLNPVMFQRMNGGRGKLEDVLAGVDAALEAGLSPIKVNSVVVRDMNDASFEDIAEYFRGTGVELRFIEYMDVGTRNDWEMGKVVTASEIVERLAARWPLEPLQRRSPSEVAGRYRYTDGKGTVGVVSSVTAPFCGACTRARLTTNGRLVNCLFAEGGVDLKGPLRSGASDRQLTDIILGSWRARDDRYSELRTRATSGAPPRQRRMEMYQLGG
ncbi:MAG: GTP 3',8-cyclase MoaA [Proteobacteria bacterium]|nr:GTP 3',8-cyclase MoaA [Pseudomonadota bacterium]